MAYANYKCTVRYVLSIGASDRFGRTSSIEVRDNAIPLDEGRVVAICPDEATARKTQAALEAVDGADWVRMSNAALAARQLS